MRKKKRKPITVRLKGGPKHGDVLYLMEPVRRIALPFSDHDQSNVAQYVLMRGKYLNSAWVGHYQK
jgi:hypothetical protein